MKKSRFTDEQIVFALQQAELGTSVSEVCKLTGLSLSTCRYETQCAAADAHLSGRITELALERRRF